ncbi:orotate phosphoribosyltransferase [Catalinimonas alkaloidigena]|uniref:Orotate phosphoribosyltransferase n=1 Tax=Catalinimonas alkaloidigena TaxID=1075417 RepID=A0A1G8XXX1_9BACT|nr:orotate phosphoribosyltransferase [Catalinimonas alkaloidigena]SDJ95388.1 orotate phosphoribosyltransferase [Catalinimonas alkaloidigena]
MIRSRSIASAVATQLLQINAIRLNPEHPFRWSSGWNSPIYCDNRLTLSYPSIRSYIMQEIIAVIRACFPNVEAIAGVATAGIPQATLVANSLELPLLYVRSSPKGHGMQNRIEGRVVPGQKVVVIEDLISTGKSSIQAAEALKEEGIDVLGLVAIFTYGFPQADENFAPLDYPCYCLSDYDTMLDVAVAENYIAQDSLQSLSDWRHNPEGWKPQRQQAS